MGLDVDAARVNEPERGAPERHPVRLAPRILGW